jgi:hypothetical protein
MHGAREVMMITRKIFLRQLTGGSVALLLGGCGGGGEVDDETPEAPAGATCHAFSFTANHGHVLSIPEADLDAPGDKTYSTRGTAPHDHPVTLTAIQRQQLKAGQPILFTAPSGGASPHTHDVSGTCT